MALFVQLDVYWPDNPKVMRVGLAGAGLHAAAMCLAKRMDTDGVLHRTHLYRLGADDDLIDLCIDEGLFDVVEYGSRAGEDPGRGYVVRIHDWHDRNLSQDAIAAIRTAKKEGAREGNHKRWKHPGDVADCPMCNARKPSVLASSHPSRIATACDPDASDNARSQPREGRAAEQIAPPDNPSVLASDRMPIGHAKRVRSPELELESELEDTRDLFASFWALYPRKIARKRASIAWRNLTKADQQAALDALPNHIAAWKRERRPPDKIPHPTTWLHDARWNDEINGTPIGDTRHFDEVLGVYVDGHTKGRQ